MIDRNFVENFEWQLKMSRFLMELTLSTDLPYLRLAQLNALRMIKINLLNPLHVVSVIQCQQLVSVTVESLLIIDSSAYKIRQLNYKVVHARLSLTKDNSHLFKIEQNCLNAFGLLSGPI